MSMIKNSKVYAALHIALIFAAFLLSALDGLIIILAALMFSYLGSPRIWEPIYFPTTLWIPAIICFWFPRAGFAAYAVILAVSIILLVDPMSYGSFRAWYRCSEDLRFAILGCALLLVNIFIPRGSLRKAGGK